MTWLSVERKTAVRRRTPRETEARLASRPPAGHDSHLPVQAPRPPPQARCFQVGRRDPPKLAWWEGQGHCPLGTLSPVSTRSHCQVPRARARPRSHNWNHRRNAADAGQGTLTHPGHWCNFKTSKRYKKERDAHRGCPELRLH